METCMTCKWCEVKLGLQPGQGLCHFNPPIPLVMGITPKGPMMGSAQTIVDLMHDFCSHRFAQMVKPVLNFRNDGPSDPEVN